MGAPVGLKCDFHEMGLKIRMRKKILNIFKSNDYYLLIMNFKYLRNIFKEICNPPFAELTHNVTLRKWEKIPI
jgi:hypothetical protein